MKQKLLRLLLLLAGVALFALLLYFAFLEAIPELLPLLRSGQVEEIQSYFRENNTVKGVLSAFLLQAVQVWTVVLSGVPIQVAAGIVYGTLGGFAICHLSSTVAMTSSLLCWRKAGKQLQSLLPVNRKYQLLSDRLLQLDISPKFTAFLAGMIPALPNGLVPIVLAKMKISPRDFAICVWLGSLPNIFLCCAIGNRLIQGDWILALVYLLVMLAIVVVLWVYQRPILQWLRKSRSNRKARPDS